MTIAFFFASEPLSGRSPSRSEAARRNYSACLVLSEGITESSFRGRRPKNLLLKKGTQFKERLLSGIEGLSFHQGQIVPGVVRKK